MPAVNKDSPKAGYFGSSSFRSLTTVAIDSFQKNRAKHQMKDYYEMNKGVIAHLVDKSDILREMAASIVKYEPLLSSVAPRKSGLLLGTAKEILEAARELINEGIARCEHEQSIIDTATLAADIRAASPPTVTEPDLQTENTMLLDATSTENSQS